MSEIVFCILMALVRCGGLAPLWEVEDVSGYDISGKNFRAIKILKELGLIEHYRYRRPGSLVITEKGKIALAIEVGKRTRQYWHKQQERRKQKQEARGKRGNFCQFGRRYRDSRCLGCAAFIGCTWKLAPVRETKPNVKRKHSKNNLRRLRRIKYPVTYGLVDYFAYTSSSRFTYLISP